MKINLYLYIINLNTNRDSISIIIEFHQQSLHDKIMFNKCKQNTNIAVYTVSDSTLILITPIKCRSEIYSFWLESIVLFKGHPSMP